MRTPLHGILGVTRLLHLEASDRAVARRLELIESSGTHLLGLINDLLDISRIEAGQFAIRSERFELGAVVQNLADLYTVRAADKGLDFTLTMQLEPPCWVTGDPARVRQVLHNLLGNAVKFTQHGSITLTLMRDAESGRLSAEVQDTGPGIEAADLLHVFEAFRQVGGASSRPFEGTGLGLTIARDIARAMGGDIGIRSTVGVGSCALFTALLPTAPAPEARAEPAQPSAALGSDACRGRVLIAEDDDVNAVIATAYLEHMGMTAERVKDGRLAVRQALRETDRPRPGADGLPHADDGRHGRDARNPHPGTQPGPGTRSGGCAHGHHLRCQPPVMPERRHGRLHVQALYPRGSAAGAATLGAARRRRRQLIRPGPSAAGRPPHPAVVAPSMLPDRHAACRRRTDRAGGALRPSAFALKSCRKP